MNIQELKSFYNQRVGRNQSEVTGIRKSVHLLGTARLIVVMIAITLLFVFWGQMNVCIYAALLLCLFSFFRMVFKSNKLNKRKDYLQSSIVTDNDELKAIEYDFSSYDGASERICVEHPFSLDLDLFGHRSVFQSLNRTASPMGKNILAEWFENPLRDKQKILERQNVVREMCSQPSLLHHFEVTGRLNPGKQQDNEDLKHFANQPSPWSKKSLWTVLSYLFFALWIAVIFLVSGGMISFSVVSVFYVITFAVSESCFKKVSALQSQVGKKMKILENYSALIEIVESCDLDSMDILEIKRFFRKEGISASKEIKRLAQLSGELEQRANMLVHLVLNPVFLWDIRKAIAIERWKEKNGILLQDWLLKLGEFDALCSLGKYAFNHPDYIYPEVVDCYFEMEGREMGHPLLHRDICIKNDVNVVSSPNFMIITGANMAGKSTFLRTIGINYLLACVGAPVYASYLRIYPALLYTSLRTSDSLNDNESYFYAELKRLKAIIDELNNGKQLFIILDEILKGTNSVDKQKGSFALIKQFVEMKACGIIATHDLALGSLEKEFPEFIGNYHFDADIIDDELYFSYRLRNGIARNMNACFLMKKMGIFLL
ncbi:DNA mismatch repair protein MutS [Bacteroidia bacterium]|nr:DNA mismatch repair protein MutS [Bacteroidia bacterium]